MIDFTERKEQFEHLHGPVNSPSKYVQYCTHLGRQAGKTEKLIEILPNDKRIVVIGWSYKWNMELKKMVEETRPDIDIRNVKFVSYRDKVKYRMLMDEIRPGTPIYVDNSVLDMIQAEFVSRLNDTHRF